MNQIIEKINRSKRFKNRSMNDSLKLLIFLTYGEEETREKAALARINRSHLYQDRTFSDRVKLASLLDDFETNLGKNNDGEQSKQLLMLGRTAQGLNKLLHHNTAYRLASSEELLDFINSSADVFSGLTGESFWVMNDGDIRAVNILNKKSVADTTYFHNGKSRLRSLLILKQPVETEETVEPEIEVANSRISLLRVLSGKLPLFQIDQLRPFQHLFTDFKHHTMFWCLNGKNVVVWMPHSNSFRSPTDHDYHSLIVKIGDVYPDNHVVKLNDEKPSVVSIDKEQTTQTKSYTVEHGRLDGVEESVAAGKQLATAEQIAALMLDDIELLRKHGNSLIWALNEDNEVIPLKFNLIDPNPQAKSFSFSPLNLIEQQRIPCLTAYSIWFGSDATSYKTMRFKSADDVTSTLIDGTVYQLTTLEQLTEWLIGQKEVNQPHIWEVKVKNGTETVVIVLFNHRGNLKFKSLPLDHYTGSVNCLYKERVEDKQSDKVSLDSLLEDYHTGKISGEQLVTLIRRHSLKFGA